LGPNLPAACAACEKREPYEPSAWFDHIWFLYRLQRGGYPFAANDLAIEEWQALGELTEALEIEQRALLKPPGG
jgi:hypothetical protein